MTTVLGILRFLGWRGVLAVALLAALAVQTVRLNVVEGQKAAAEGRYAKESLQAVHARLDRAEVVRAFEQQSARLITSIAHAFEEGKRNASLARESLVADLRAGNVRLRREWLACEGRPAAVPGAAAGTAERDADTERRYESAGDLVRIADESDAQLAACQAIVEADRRVMPAQ